MSSEHVDELLGAGVDSGEWPQAVDQVSGVIDCDRASSDDHLGWARRVAYVCRPEPNVRSEFGKSRADHCLTKGATLGHRATVP